MIKSPQLRALFLALAGVAMFAYWATFDPTNDAKASQFEWQFVIGFTGALLLLAFALFLFGDTVGGKWEKRFARVAALGSGLSGVANVFEDGFGIEWVFFVFILGTAVSLLGLIALAIVLAAKRPGSRKLLALFPASTVVGIIGFVAFGGPLLLVTWVGAAFVAFKNTDLKPQSINVTPPPTTSAAPDLQEGPLHG